MQERYLKLLEDVKRVLEPRGVTLSVNHWHSIMHADLGKRMSEELPFRPMVDVEGSQAQLCVCPLDTAWQDHLAALYRRYAALRPHILWVEDDFRFHNHAPLEWGGCFCEAHMELYSRMAGHPVRREDFVQGVLQPGEPHPYRKIWLDACRRTLVEIAGRLEEAAHAVSPETRLGRPRSTRRRAGTGTACCGPSPGTSPRWTASTCPPIRRPPPGGTC